MTETTAKGKNVTEVAASLDEVRIKRGKEIAKQAGKLFVKVSNSYPASEASQAAAVAIEIREEQLPFTAQEAWTELIREEYNQDVIDSLVNQATTAHKHNDAEEKAGIITEARLRDLLMGVFGLARDLVILDTEEIKTIFTFGNDLPKDTPKRDLERMRMSHATKLFIDKSLQLRAEQGIK